MSQHKATGAFTFTPTIPKQDATGNGPRSSPFRQHSNSHTFGSQNPSQKAATNPPIDGSSGDSLSLDSVERAARTIDETLTQEAKYPELDSYVSR